MMALAEAPADAPEVLFLGEAPRNSYVEGALSTAFRQTKLHSGQPLAGSDAERRLGEHALVVLTDYPARNRLGDGGDGLAARRLALRDPEIIETRWDLGRSMRPSSSGIAAILLGQRGD